MSVSQQGKNRWRMRLLRTWGGLREGAIEVCDERRSQDLFNTGFWEFLPFAARRNRKVTNDVS